MNITEPLKAKAAALGEERAAINQSSNTAKYNKPDSKQNNIISLSLGGVGTKSEKAALILPFTPENTRFEDDERPALMEPGIYEVALSSYWKGRLYGGKAAKLILRFRLLSEGPYFGKLLNRCYNIQGLTGRGEIIPASWSSTLVREYSRLFGVPRKRRDIGVRAFKGKIFKARVRTVTHDARQRLLPKDLHYSVIDELLEIAAG